ncbi:MAG: tetratricopeptide repeat protein, partial [Bacteroidota bacterium]
ALLSQLFLAKNEVEQGVMFAEEGFRFLEDNVPNNHVALWAEVYLQLSQAYLKRQEYSRSLEMSQHLLQLSRQLGDVEKEALALHNIAVVCGVKSNYKIGMQYFLEALDKCETIGYRELSAQIQINLGTLYAHLYNYEEAINRYQKVLAEHSDILEDKIRVALYNNLGNIFFTTEQPQQALSYFEKANTLADECQHQEMFAHSLAQLSRTKISMNRLSEAEQDAHWAAELFERLGDVNGKQIHLMNLGHLAHLKNRFDEAVDLTNQAVETAKKLKDDAGEIRGYKLLSLIFKAKGDFAKALEFQERYAEIQEEFARVQRNRQVLDLEIRQAIREKQKEIEQLTKENEYQALLLQKSDQIARQNQELLRANEELRQFAYVASHDLREPLRMIGSYTQIIQRLTQDKLGDKEKQYFTFVTEGVHRMNNLLEGLLKYATIANAVPEIDDVRLDDVLLICQTNLKIRIEETQAQMHCEPLPVVRSNQSLLIQLFQNLVSNALKFIPTGVQPVVRIFSESNENEHIVAVQDNGIGLAPQQTLVSFVDNHD